MIVGRAALGVCSTHDVMTLKRIVACCLKSVILNKSADRFPGNGMIMVAASVLSLLLLVDLCIQIHDTETMAWS